MNDSDNTDEQSPFGSTKDEVEIFHRINRLRRKAGGDEHGGAGMINLARIRSAETIIEKFAEKYPHELKLVLDKINGAWADIQSPDMTIAKKGIEELYHAANQLKDLASTCNSPLMQHFGLSLRKFMERFDLSREEHRIIVKAHIDVIKVAYHANMKDGESEKAEELKMIVAQAIERYG